MNQDWKPGDQIRYVLEDIGEPNYGSPTSLDNLQIGTIVTVTSYFPAEENHGASLEFKGGCAWYYARHFQKYDPFVEAVKKANGIQTTTP